MFGKRCGGGSSAAWREAGTVAGPARRSAATPRPPSRRRLPRLGVCFLSLISRMASSFDTLKIMDEIRPEQNPGPAPAVEKEAAAQSGEPPRWGKGTEGADDGQFLEGPHPRSSELARLVRVGKDFVRGFRGLHFVGPCVTVFGSARFPESHRYYELAREVGRRLGRAGFTVLTGGGPGIMEAANRGARDVGAPSLGLNIQLPHEQRPNPYVDRW